MGWLIALGILVLLAILPLGVSVRYDAAGPLVRIVAGPVRLQVYPGRKKEPKQKAQQAEKKEKPAGKPKSQEAAPEKGGSLTDFLPLAKIGLELLDGFRRKLRVDRLELKLILAADDPCDLAVNYGRAWASVGNLWPALERCFVIKKRDVEVQCDFTASEALVVARLDLTITLGRLLGLAVYHGIRALVAYFQIQKSKKGGTNA